MLVLNVSIMSEKTTQATSSLTSHVEKLFGSDSEFSDDTPSASMLCLREGMAIVPIRGRYLHGMNVIPMTLLSG